MKNSQRCFKYLNTPRSVSADLVCSTRGGFNNKYFLPLLPDLFLPISRVQPVGDKRKSVVRQGSVCRLQTRWYGAPKVLHGDAGQLRLKMVFQVGRGRETHALDVIERHGVGEAGFLWGFLWDEGIPRSGGTCAESCGGRTKGARSTVAFKFKFIY